MGIVHIMNNKSADQDTYKTFQLMHEIEDGDAISQRELAGRLGIAVGLVNSYLKNFVAKGFVRVKNYPRNRYGYLLTPKGLSEKSRLAYQHLNYFNSLYKVTRRDYTELFASLSAQGVGMVAFCGVDEVAEIAYLSLRETSIQVGGVFSDDRVGEFFFQQPIKSLHEVEDWQSGPVIVTLAKGRKHLFEKLNELRLPVSVHCPGIKTVE